jgi:hypothetical protein
VYPGRYSPDIPMRHHASFQSFSEGCPCYSIYKAFKRFSLFCGNGCRCYWYCSYRMNTFFSVATLLPSYFWSVDMIRAWCTAGLWYSCPASISRSNQWRKWQPLSGLNLFTSVRKIILLSTLGGCEPRLKLGLRSPRQLV